MAGLKSKKADGGMATKTMPLSSLWWQFMTFNIKNCRRTDEPFQINITEDNVMRRRYDFVNFDAAEHTMVGQTKQTQAWQAKQKSVHPSLSYLRCDRTKDAVCTVVL